MLQSIERYMKQAIVDKCYAVSSAALASSLVSILSCLGTVNGVLINFFKMGSRELWCGNVKDILNFAFWVMFHAMSVKQ